MIGDECEPCNEPQWLTDRIECFNSTKCEAPRDGDLCLSCLDGYFGFMRQCIGACYEHATVDSQPDAL